MRQKIRQIASMLAISIMAVSSAQAQVTQVWERRYNGAGNGDDVANAITVDKFGNVIVTGKAHEGSTGFDIVTRSYSLSGVLNWFDRYSGFGSGEDEGVALVVDDDGGWPR